MTLPPTDARLALLLDYAHLQGITVHRANLPGRERGRYDHEAHRILIQEGMSPAQEVSVLAHELVHAQRGDLGPQSPEREAAVQEMAATLVISTTDYARAEAICGPDAWALARELDVTPDLVQAWQARAHRTLTPALQ